MSDRFDGMLYGVEPTLREVLEKVSVVVKQNTEEIRLRENLPLALTVAGDTVFVKKDGQTSHYITDNLVSVSHTQLRESFRLLCDNSAFAHTEELKNGYIKLKNGSRAGVFGTVNAKEDMEKISCINIRIAREIKGTATKIATAFRGEGWLIAGPPASGKTTVLRDLIRQISRGIYGKFYRVAVIDSRGEISGNGFNDLGLTCDVLNIEDKAKGTQIALRTMFPEVIAFDEIGTVDELKKVKEAFNSGVAVVTTAHIGDKTELMKKSVTRELLMSGAISRVAVLPKLLGGEIEVLSTREIIVNYA